MSAAETKGLPANLDVERLVLGSIMLDASLYPQVAASLAIDDFSLEKHRRIFTRMGELYARGENPDYPTLGELLDSKGDLDACGGMAYLVSLDDGLPQIYNLEGYFRILREKGDLRRTIFACSHLMNQCILANGNAGEILSNAGQMFSEIGKGSNPNLVKSISLLPSIKECGAGQIEYLMDPLLPLSAVVAFTGDSGSGKSTVLCAIAGKVAADGVPVLVLDRENPLPVIAEREARLKISGKLRYWGGWLPEEAPQPAAPIVLEWVKTCEPRPLVIVDSLAAFHGGDQNDAGEMRAFMHQCRKLADLGATVGVIHHDGKADTAKDYRGSSDFKAAVDAAFHVSNFGEDGRLGKVVLRCFKSRYGFAGEVVFDYADGRFVRQSEPETVTQAVTEQLTSLLRTNPGITGKKFEELANDRRLGRNRARTFLNDGVLAGKITREPGTSGGKRHYFVLEVDSNGA